jgi:hypothetical protein
VLPKKGSEFENRGFLDMTIEEEGISRGDPAAHRVKYFTILRVEEIQAPVLGFESKPPKEV